MPSCDLIRDRKVYKSLPQRYEDLPGAAGPAAISMGVYIAAFRQP